VHVIYPDGTPVTNLSPMTISFQWVGPSGKTELDNQPVTPVPGKPGYYNYTAPLSSDIVQATGQGQLTLSVVTCSCSDGFGNRGPTGVISSIETIIPSDDSRVGIEQPPPPPEQFPSTLFPIIILALLVLALIALLLRRRRKKT
jgi:MYXO-CTERM domain-containing protein